MDEKEVLGAVMNKVVGAGVEALKKKIGLIVAVVVVVGGLLAGIILGIPIIVSRGSS